MSTIKTKRLKPPGKCIFCDGGKLTREHIWPQWAADLLPNSPHNTSLRGTLNPRGRLVGEPRLYRRQGGVKNVTVRVVCSICNNGWMSAIEERAKPTLRNLALGDPVEFDARTQKSLVDWIVLKMMIAEHSPPADPAFAQIDRVNFFLNREIPKGIEIFLYLCGHEKWRSSFRRWAGTISATRNPKYDTKIRNSASVTLGFGQAIIQCCYFGDPDIIQSPLQFSGGVFLWPSEIETSWPPTRRLSDRDASAIAEAFERLRRTPKVRIVD